MVMPRIRFERTLADGSATEGGRRPTVVRGAFVNDAGDALWLEIGAIGDADLAFDDGDPVKPLPPCSSVSSKKPKRSLGRSKALWMRQSLLPFSFRPAFGTVVASMIRIRRPWLA